MTSKSRLVMLASAGVFATAIFTTANFTAAFAQQGRRNPAEMARHAQMALNMYYLSEVGYMARGSVPYDAAKAKAAAASLVALAGTDWSGYWAKGTDSKVSSHSKMLPAVYGHEADLLAKQKGVEAAALKLEKVAGDGRAGLGPAVFGLLKACNACHRTYRAPLN